MKRTTAILAFSVGLSIAGCGKNEQARNAAELEKAFAAGVRAAEAPKPDAANYGGPTQGQSDHVQQTVSQAVSDLKTNGYLEAFVALKAVQAAPTLTLDQYTAVANARLAVERELAAKAAAGDPAAMRALEGIKGASRR